MTKRQAALLDRLEAWYAEHEHATVIGAALDMRMPTEAVQAVTVIGLSEGRLVLVGESVYTMGWLVAIAAKLIAAFGDSPIHPAQVREFLGQSRQWTENLANTLEQTGWLEREPGGWVLQQGSER